MLGKCPLASYIDERQFIFIIHSCKVVFYSAGSSRILQAEYAARQEPYLGMHDLMSVSMKLNVYLACQPKRELEN